MGRGLGFLAHASGFAAVGAIVAEGLEAFGRNVFVEGGDKVGAGEEFKVSLGAPTAGGAVEDALGLRVPVHFLQGHGGTKEVLRETFEGFAIVGTDSGFTLVDIEAVVVPAQELVGLARGNPLELK